MKLHGSKEIAARGGVGIEGEDGCLEVYSEDEKKFRKGKDEAECMWGAQEELKRL